MQGKIIDSISDLGLVLKMLETSIFTVVSLFSSNMILHQWEYFSFFLENCENSNSREKNIFKN